MSLHWVSAICISLPHLWWLIKTHFPAWTHSVAPSAVTHRCHYPSKCGRAEGHGGWPWQSMAVRQESGASCFCCPHLAHPQCTPQPKCPRRVALRWICFLINTSSLAGSWGQKESHAFQCLLTSTGGLEKGLPPTTPDHSSLVTHPQDQESSMSSCHCGAQDRTLVPMCQLSL